MLVKRGFTLIELLVVISIIGVLSAVATVMYNVVRERARMGAVTADMRQIEDAIELGRTRSNKTLREITGNNCSSCACDNTGFDIWKDYGPNHQCRLSWQNALTNIQEAGGAVEKLIDIKKDPWGAPYALDENEGEGGSTDCQPDSLRSVGPDSKWNTSDDILMNIPFSLSTCL